MRFPTALRYRAAAAGALAWALGAAAQPAPGPAAQTAAQQRYERAIAACNNGSLPAPAREACVREAGVQLDLVRGGPPATTTMTSPDGRATVVAPQPGPPSGLNPASTSDNTALSRDGRATIVLPQ